MNVKISMISLALLAATAPSFAADKIAITGEPVDLTAEGDYYVLPSDYKATTNYYYVNVAGNKEVCYAKKQHGMLADVTPNMVKVKMNGKMMTWNCYTYSDTYFVAK